jgi:hypothetical protein
MEAEAAVAVMTGMAEMVEMETTVMEAAEMA